MKLLFYFFFAIFYTLSLPPLRVHYFISTLLYFLLRSSFPEKSETQLRRIERAYYRFFCDYLVESIKLLTISPEEIKRRLVFKGTEVVNLCVEEGQSCAVYLGHYCNWEWITSLPLWVTPKAQCGQIYHPIENNWLYL